MRTTRAGSHWSQTAPDIFDIADNGETRHSSSISKACLIDSSSENAKKEEKKLKKRVQNRVAQRKYRKRMKHKITDLERKLRELDAMEQQTQHARVPASMATSGSDHSLSGPGLDVQGFPEICGSSAAALPYPLTISNEAAPFDVAHSHNTNPNDALQFYAGLMTPAAATENAVDILHQALIDAQYHTAADLVHQAPGNNPGEMLYSNLGVQSSSIDQYGLFDSKKSSASIEETSYSIQSKIQPPPQVNVPLAGSPDTDGGLPMSIEESFNFVLKCARKAGFDSFDSMVCQYYTSTFDKSSDLSIEQRESRNHRLPALLANLREHSTTWSTSEHDGYHDEILRSAEKLYLRERRSFEELSEPVSLAAAQSHFPNTWALVSALSGNIAPFCTDCDERTAFTLSIIRQIYGLERPET